MTSHLSRHVWPKLKWSHNVRWNGRKSAGQARRRVPFMFMAWIGLRRLSGQHSCGTAARFGWQKSPVAAATRVDFSHFRYLRSLAALAPSLSLTPDSQSLSKVHIPSGLLHSRLYLAGVSSPLPSGLSCTQASTSSRTRTPQRLPCASFSESFP